MLDWVCERGLRTWSSCWTESTRLEQNSRWSNVCTKQTTSDCYSLSSYHFMVDVFLLFSVLFNSPEETKAKASQRWVTATLSRPPFFSSSLYFSFLFFVFLFFISNCVCPETQVFVPAGRPDGQDLPRTKTQPGRRRVSQRRWRRRFQLIFFSSLKNHK